MLLLTPALLVSGQQQFDLPPPVLRDVQIVGFYARVHWDFWEPTYSCAEGIYQLAFQEGCESMQPSSNATFAFACSLPCEVSEGTASVVGLEVERDKSYSFFLRVQCNLWLAEDDYSYSTGETVVTLTNYSAPVCIHGNSSLIGTSPPAFGSTSIFATLSPPFRDCLTNTLYNISLFPDCNLDMNAIVHTTYELVFFITDLQPNTWYLINVRGYCNGSWIGSEPICNKTYSVPLEVVGVSTTSTISATVKWKSYVGTENECFSVAFYSISLFTDYNSYVPLTVSFQPISFLITLPLPIFVTALANSTMTTVEGLEENTEYFVLVLAHCSFPPDNSVFAEQLFRVSTFEPLIKIVDVIPGVYGAYITWTVPPCTKPTYEVLAQVGCSGEGGAEDSTHRSNKNYTTIDSLMPYTYYDFSVTAYCNATYQLRSHRTCIRTSSAPPAVTNMSATVSTVSITWNRSTCNSFLYEINITTGCEAIPDSNVAVYRVFNITVESGTPQQPTSEPDRPNAGSSNTLLSQHTTSIHGLLPGTDYGIKIRSFCAAGSEITGYSDVTCVMTAEPDIECNSSVAFYALSQNSDIKVVSYQLVAAIYDPISNGNTYFGVDLEDQLFLLEVNVLGSRGLLPFGTDYGDVEYEYSYSDSSYYGLQYTLPKPLPFFGKDHSILYVNARGFISIGEPYLNPWSRTPFPLTGEVPMVAAFWWWYYTKAYIHSYNQGSSVFDDAVIRVVGERLQQFETVNSTFQPETLVSITWSLVSVATQYVLLLD